MKAKVQKNESQHALHSFRASKSYRRFETRKSRFSHLPPDQETITRLNAVAKEYPFCIFYKAKNNDPY